MAVIGSLVSAAYRDSLDGAALPPEVLAPARESIGAANAVAGQVLASGDPGDAGSALLDASHQAFASAMTSGFTAAAVVALVGAVVVAVFLPRRRPDSPEVIITGDEVALATA